MQSGDDKNLTICADFGTILSSKQTKTFWLPGSGSSKQKYADPRIRIQGADYQAKTVNKNILL